MEENTKEITFSKRLKIAIFGLENYGIFLLEKIMPAIKYIFSLLLILAVLVGIVSTYRISKIVYKAIDYLKTELPEFTYDNGELFFSDNVEAYDEEYEFYFCVNTNSEIDETTIEEYKNEIIENGIILLKNKAIIKIYDSETEINYSDISNELSITSFSKSDLLDNINYDSITNLSLIYLLDCVITEYLTLIIVNAVNVFAITILADITANVCAIAIDKKHLIALSIYSISLSVILNTIYKCILIIDLINEIAYFNTICFLISCVYIIAAIFMIKADVIKQKQELSKITEEQRKIRLEELTSNKDKTDDEKTDEKNDKKNDKEKDNDSENTDEEPLIGNNEPDGSEI